MRNGTHQITSNMNNEAGDRPRNNQPKKDSEWIN